MPTTERQKQMRCRAAAGPVLVALLLAVSGAGCGDREPDRAATTSTTNNTTTTAENNQNNLDEEDRKFLEDAGRGGHLEVQLGTLATQKATNPAVQQFGRRMVDEHAKANTELSALASQRGVTLPAGLDEEGRELSERLSKLSGAEFDEEYVQAMVKDHEKDVREYKEAADDVEDADIKAFAARQVPILEAHLSQARDLEKQVD